MNRLELILNLIAVAVLILSAWALMWIVWAAAPEWWL